MMRRLLPIVLLAALAQPASAEPCNELNFYSGYRLSVPPATVAFSHDTFTWIGCATGHDTDYILPGSSYGQVFVEGATPPVGGTLLEDGTIDGSWLRLGADRVVPLSWTRGVSARGVPANFWYSGDVPYTQEESVAPEFRATAHVCYPDETCVERTYRTMTTA